MVELALFALGLYVAVVAGLAILAGLGTLFRGLAVRPRLPWRRFRRSPWGVAAAVYAIGIAAFVIPAWILILTAA